MKNQVSLDDQAWQATFPNRVSPLEDEWLGGLLLRCDEVNDWTSKTTFLYIKQMYTRNFSRKTIRLKAPNFITNSKFNLTHLAQLLAVPESAILGTTYQREFLSLNYTYHSLSNTWNQFSLFHICPECIAENRLLRRMLVLPFFTACPYHHVILREQCVCGAQLELFNQKAPPFHCFTCGAHWLKLPRRKVAPARREYEQNMLAWYNFIFENGDVGLIWDAKKLVMKKTIQLVKGKDTSPTITRLVKFCCTNHSRKLPSLSILIALLADCGITPLDLINPVKL